MVLPSRPLNPLFPSHYSSLCEPSVNKVYWLYRWLLHGALCTGPLKGRLVHSEWFICSLCSFCARNIVQKTLNNVCSDRQCFLKILLVVDGSIWRKEKIFCKETGTSAVEENITSTHQFNISSINLRLLNLWQLKNYISSSLSTTSSVYDLSTRQVIMANWNLLGKPAPFKRAANIYSGNPA